MGDLDSIALLFQVFSTAAPLGKIDDAMRDDVLITQLDINDSPFTCPKCRAWVGVVRAAVLYLWHPNLGIGISESHRATEPIKLKCGKCSATIRWYTNAELRHKAAGFL